MRNPKVSIGLPVYNGEKYLEEAIESILAQTFEDFELIISDNASTDRTQEICQKYAATDKRIRYSRNQTNIGGANNTNLTFKMSRGEYFRWAAHDDICGSTLLEKLVTVLDNDKSVILAYTMISQIDEKDNQIGILDVTKAASARPSTRFQDLFGLDHDCEFTYGLIRSDIMAKTDLLLNYSDSDRTFLCELSFYGKFYQVPEILFYKRYHSQMSTQLYKEHRERMAWFGYHVDKQITLPFWMQFFHYLRLIKRAPISVREKILCYYKLGTTWLFAYNYWRRMIKDIFLAFKKKNGF